MKVKAAVTLGYQQPFSIKDIQVSAPKKDEVMVKIVATGVCHTDAVIRDNAGILPMPAILGHEGAGIVVNVGDAVRGVEIGDHVVLSYAACHHCENCLTNHPSACESFNDLNFGGRLDDGTTPYRLDDQELSVFFGQSSFSQYVVTKATNAIVVDRDVELSLLGPLGCGIQTGSGTVFFSGCTLKCCYCQNYPISQGEVGKAISVERLTEIFMNLQNGGAKNINLVTASQYLPWVTAALDAARAQGFSLPVVYNTGGYETVDAVRALAGYVDIWLADYKYADGALAAELSAARDYPAVADAALRQMLLQTGAPVYDADGYLQKGVIVRHLALPGHVADSKAVLRRLAALREETGIEFIPSLMSQFTPFYKAAEHGLGRRITTYEYRQVIDEAVRLGLTDGYMQEKSSAREEYTPPFDLEGV